jgi:hypothetical protein
VIVVSDASPLIGLAKIDHLYLLPDLFGTVTVPSAVHYELVVLGAGLAGAEQLAAVPWLHVQAVTSRIQVDYLRADLDPGESEALVLAQELGADRFLVDEERARAVARILGIPHIGTVGILVAAKRLDHIQRISPLLDQLQQHNFYLSQRLVRMVLQQVNE